MTNITVVYGPTNKMGALKYCLIYDQSSNLETQIKNDTVYQPILIQLN